MVAKWVKLIYFGVLGSVAAVGIGSYFVPQLKPQKRDFRILSDDKRYAETVPKSKHWSAINSAIKSDEPYFGPKRRTTD